MNILEMLNNTKERLYLQFLILILFFHYNAVTMMVTNMHFSRKCLLSGNKKVKSIMSLYEKIIIRIIVAKMNSIMILIGLFIIVNK